MTDIDVAVIGGGVAGLAAHSRSPNAGARCACSSANRTPGHGDQHAQQRRHSRRHLLPHRLAQGRAVRRGPRAALRLLRRATTCRTRAAASSSSPATTDEIPALGSACSRRAPQRRRGRDGGSRLSARRASRTCPPSPRCGRPTPASSRPKRYVRRWSTCAATATSRCVVGSPLIGADAAAGGIELVTPHESIRRHHRRQRRRPLRRRRVARCSAARRSHLPVPRRVRGAGAGAGATW